MSVAAPTLRRGVRRRDAPLVQLPWGQPLNTLGPVDLLSADEIEALHATSLRILETIGVWFHDDDARDIFRRAGAEVDEDSRRVRIGRDIVEEALSRVVPAFTLTPRNPERAVRIGDGCLAFTTVLGPPVCTDLERGRRPGTLADFADLMCLGQHFNVIHMMAGSAVEPGDVPVPLRHLQSTRTMLRLSDKVPYVFCHSRRRIHDTLDMIAMTHGLRREDLATTPSTYAIINTNSPLQYDGPMAGSVIEMARHGQPVLLTPFSLAGATMPVSFASAIAMSDAEMLAGLMLAQFVRPGAPFVTGPKTLNVDMKTGAPAFGSGQGNQAVLVGAQLARRYGLPFRASNFSSSNAPDAQAAWESQGTLWGPSPPAPASSCMPRAGSRAACRRATRNSSWIATSSA